MRASVHGVSSGNNAATSRPVQPTRRKILSQTLQCVAKALFGLCVWKMNGRIELAPVLAGDIRAHRSTIHVVRVYIIALCQGDDFNGRACGERGGLKASGTRFAPFLHRGVCCRSDFPERSQVGNHGVSIGRRHRGDKCGCRRPRAGASAKIDSDLAGWRGLGGRASRGDMLVGSSRRVRCVVDAHGADRGGPKKVGGSETGCVKRRVGDI